MLFLTSALIEVGQTEGTRAVCRLKERKSQRRLLTPPENGCSTVCTSVAVCTELFGKSFRSLTPNKILIKVLM